MRTVLLITLAAFSLAAGPAPLAHAQPTAPAPPSVDNPGLGIRLLEAPLDLADDPRAATYIIDNLPPGTAIHRRIEISNRTGAPQSVQIYPGAAHVDSDTGFVLEEGAAINELTTWMSVDRPTIELTDGQTQDVTVTVDVPTDAPEGEQYAVLWAQIAGADPAGSGATVVNRVGIRIYLSVGPGNGPPADYVIDTLTPARDNNGQPQIIAEFTNTGGRAVDVNGTVTLTDGPGGISAGPFPATTSTVGPGHKGQAVFNLNSQLPDGPWTAKVELTSGILHRANTATLTIPDNGTGTSIADQASHPARWIWIAALTVLAAVAIAVAVAAARSKRRPSR